MAVERTELELLWPADLFAQEALALIEAGNTDSDTLGLLLAEAFHDDRGRLLLNETDATDASRNPWPPSSPSEQVPLRTELVADLARDATNLPRHQKRVYYSARRSPTTPAVPLTLFQVREAYARLVADLTNSGYFEDAFGSSCVDDADNPEEEGQQQLAHLLGTTKSVWPLAKRDGPTNYEQDWSEDLFYDVIEALHDLVARPRSRYWHDYGTEWDYANFARTPGRAIYRWLVNELLERSVLPLRLADSGTDCGRLVHTPGSPRELLVQRASSTPAPSDRSAVGHAVELFRGRSASREDKRSAVTTLARVLEDRRGLLKQTLLSKDEGALFQIANEFDVRHRKANQHDDYDDAYLDWLFWWYLATVELSDHLIDRQTQRL